MGKLPKGDRLKKCHYFKLTRTWERIRSWCHSRERRKVTPEGPVGRLSCSSLWNGAFPLMGCVTTDLMDLVNYSPLRRDDLLCCPTGVLCAALTALPVACPGLGRKPVAICVRQRRILGAHVCCCFSVLGSC